MNKIKTIFIVIISILTINIAKAEEIQVYFYDEGATSSSSNVTLENGMVSLTSTYDYYSTYDTSGTIKVLNSINGEYFTLQKTGYHLIPNKEWFAYDEEEQVHYFSQNKEYKISDIIEELKMGNDALIMLDLHANWESNTEVVTSIKFNKNSLYLTEGKKEQLSISILPPTDKVPDITWESSNSNVVTVSKKGKVTAVSPGFAIITARSNNGSSNNCYVEVSAKGAHTVTITYNINGGKLLESHGIAYTIKSNTIYKDNKKYEQSVVNDGKSKIKILKYNNPSHVNIWKKGYKAVTDNQWNTKKNGKGISFKQGKEYKAEQLCETISKEDCNITLYLNWEDAGDEKITVTYNMNGGSGCSNSSFQVDKNDSVTYGEYEKLCQPTHSSYTFEGWHMGSVKGTKITDESKVTKTKDHTLVAKWGKRIGSVYFLDTSASSESVLIRSPKGKYVILDNALNTETDANICTKLVNNINEIIKQNGDEVGKIEYMILSHPHGDHIGCTNTFIKNLSINKVLLKKYDDYKNYNYSSDLVYYKNANRLVDTLDDNSYKNILTMSDNKDYLTLPIDNMKIHLFSYKDVFGRNSKCNDRIFDVTFAANTNLKNEKAEVWNVVASDGNNNYYYLDIKDGSSMKKANKKKIIKLMQENETDSNGALRYYFAFVNHAGGQCNANSNALALLLEFETKKGPKYAYLPSDLGNLNYGVFDNSEKIGGVNGNITSTDSPIELKSVKSISGTMINNPNPNNKNILHQGDSKRVINPVLKVTSRKDKKGTTYYDPVKGNNYVTIDVEARTAIKVKRKVESGKNILVYQPSHHSYNNDGFAVKVLGVNNNKTYYVVSNGNFSPKKTTIYNQKSYYYSSKNVKNSNHFTASTAKYITSNNAIIADFYYDGTVNMTGKFINCPTSKSSCKEGIMQ